MRTASTQKCHFYCRHKQGQNEQTGKDGCEALPNGEISMELLTTVNLDFVLYSRNICCNIFNV